jgi:uncharacterized protein YjbI with pentapeptide repeats
MPYQPSCDPSDDADPAKVAEHREQVQEQEVRLTAQRLLADHLHPGEADTPVDTFWADIDLDLTRATLINFTLQDCTARSVSFGTATFTGYRANFGGATFTGYAWFGHAAFTGDADFGLSTFNGPADFGAAIFAGYADFANATFNHADFQSAYFSSATFTRGAGFWSATFNGPADFGSATFASKLNNFRSATFNYGVPAEVVRFLPPAGEDATNPSGILR